MKKRIAEMLFFVGMVIFVLGLLLYLSPFKVVSTEAFGVDIDTLTRVFEIALMGFGILVVVLGLLSLVYRSKSTLGL